MTEPPVYIRGAASSWRLTTKLRYKRNKLEKTAIANALQLEFAPRCASPYPL